MAANETFPWIALIAGLGLGSVAAAFVGWRSAKAVTISNHRQNWINALRDDMATFLKEVDRMHTAVVSAIANPDLAGKLSELEEVQKAKESALRGGPVFRNSMAA